jgi:hypothetical protein
MDCTAHLVLYEADSFLHKVLLDIPVSQGA